MPVRRRLNPAFSPRRPGEGITADFTTDTSGLNRGGDVEIGQPQQVSPLASTGLAAAPSEPTRPSLSQQTPGETRGPRTRTRPRERAPVQPRRPVETRPQEPGPSVPTPTMSQQPDSTGSEPTIEGRPSPSLTPPPTSPVTAADRISVPMRAMEPEPTGSQPGSDGAQRPTPSISSASDPLTDVSVAPPGMPIAQQGLGPAMSSAVRPNLGPASGNLFGSAGGLGGGGIGIPGSARAEGGEPTELLLELSKLLRRR